MDIKKRLTLRFSIIVSLILVFFSLSIYISSESFRSLDFYTRLKNRGITSAKLLVDIKDMDAALLEKINRNTVNTLYNEQISIYDLNFNTIYSSIEEKQVIPIELLSEIHQNREAISNEGDKQSFGLLYTGKYGRFIVVVSANDKDGYMGLQKLKFILILGDTIAILVTIFAGWFFSKKALSPIVQIIEEVQKINHYKLNIKLDQGNEKDELSKLAITFNEMLDRISKGFEVQRSFVANASHELRTPLTSIGGSIEVTLLKKRTIEDYIETLESLLEEIRNLGKLSNNLLDLARANENIDTIKLESVRIDEVLFHAREELIKNQPTYIVNIKFIDFPDAEDKLTMLGSNQLILTVFINLMENGCKYSEDRSVTVILKYYNNSLILEFNDNGIGVPPSEINNILNPFYRASNAKQIKGHGLGLSLSAKIIELHNGRIKINSIQHKGTDIQVFLPVIS